MQRLSFTGISKIVFQIFQQDFSGGHGYWLVFVSEHMNENL